MGLKKLASAVFATGVLAGFAGCVQMPTENRSVVDQRPQITFRVNGDAQRVGSARILVDELDMGKLEDFLDGQASLRVLPGTHVVKVQSGGTMLLMERAYLGDGVVRPFNVNVN